MRVWILTEDFPPKRGGLSRWAWNTASTLAGLDHEVVVLSKRAVPREGTVPAPVSVDGRSFYALRHIYFARAVRRLLRSSCRPDLILASTWRTAEGVLLALPGCPVHTAAHGLEVFTRCTPLLRLRRRLVLQRSSIVLAASRFTAARVVRVAPAARIRVGINGVDTDLFTPDGEARPAEHGIQLLSVGRLIPRKRFDLVIEAVAAIRAAGLDAGAWIVGSGPQEAKLRRLAESAGPAVRFLGEVADGELAGLYRGSDLFLSPCMSDPASGDVEGFGLTFLEASACGTAVAGLAEGGVTDAVEDGVSGILTTRDDFVSRVVELCMSRDSLERMGRLGRERASGLFDLRRVVPGMVEVP